MANDNMKRVGLIFDAEGNVDFKKSLQSVNISLQENRNQFKLTKAQWDENTKASQKLKDTQEYLSKQYDDSSQKVKVLRSELSELENAENRDEVAIQKKKNALIAAETTMTNYKKGLEEVNQKVKSGTADMEAYAKQIGDFGKKTKDIGSSVTKNVTVPIAAIGTAALVAWNTIDDAYDNIVLKTGATGTALSDLQNSFDNVYGSMPEDSINVSNAIGEVNTRFKLTGPELEKLSTYMLKFSKITGKDVVDATKEAQFIQGNWNLTIDETTSAMGLIAKKAQDTGISVDTLMQSVNKNSFVFKEMGLSVGQSVSLLAEFEAAGLDSEQMMNGLKKAAVEYADKGMSMSDGLSDLIKRLQDSSTHQAAYNELVDMFGKKSAGSFAKAASEGRINLDNLSGDLSQYSDVVEQTYNDTLDPMDKAKVAQNNLTLAGAKLGDMIQTSLGPVFEGFTDVIKNVTNWLNGLDSGTRTMIVTIAAIVASIGPLLVIVGVVAGSISNIITLITTMKTIMAATTITTGLLSGAIAFLTSPIGIVIIAITAIIAAIILLWNNCEGFRNAVLSIWDSIQAKFMEFDTWLTQIFTIDWTKNFGFIGEVLNAFFKNIGDVWGSIKAIFSGIIDFIKNVFSGNWKGAWESIVSIFGNVFGFIYNVAKSPINLVIGLVNGMISAVENGVNFVIKCLNKISFKVPKWVPGIGGQKWGFDFDKVSLGRIALLAKGGNLLSGAALVGEAGPELLTQNGNRTTVSPLSRGGGANPVNLIDYEKMALVFLKVIKGLSINLDGSRVGEFVDERIFKAVE